MRSMGCGEDVWWWLSDAFGQLSLSIEALQGKSFKVCELSVGRKRRLDNYC